MQCAGKFHSKGFCHEESLVFREAEIKTSPFALFKFF